MLKKSLRTSKFKYWMESEIYQQPMVLADIIRAYRENNDEISIPESVKRVIVVASGSSYHCARFAVDLLERISGVETRAIYSSEFLLKNVIPKDENTLFELRLQDCSIEECAERMNISVPTAKRISQRVNKKIEREI